MEDADFSGYATKVGLKCSDGRTIMKDAFAHQMSTEALKVPLVWSHIHDDPENVLGHAYLENREDGVYCWGFFNESIKGQSTKQLVEHGDVTFLSIYANQLIEKAKNVLHGAIREVSLVLAGANPGAKIDYVALRHTDSGYVDDLDNEDVIIFTGIEIESLVHTAVVEEKVPETEAVSHAEDEELDIDTAREIYEGWSDKEKLVAHHMIGAALEKADEEKDTAEHSAVAVKTAEEKDAEKADETDKKESDDAVKHSSTTDEGDLAHKEGSSAMGDRNTFDTSKSEKTIEGPTLSHDQIRSIIDGAKKPGTTLKDSFLAHAQEYGIEALDVLFPDAKSVTDRPELLSRRTEWVKGVIDGAKHQPFSRIKSLMADLTADEARARGYVKGNLKKEEVIKLLKRVTTPTTIYKKQKLDRDDIIDITDFDVVVWLKWEMRFMLEEEIARAILIGDGREPDDDDKIDEDMLRPIAWDNDMYSHKVTVPTNTTPDGVVESIIRARKNFKGTGRPAFYTTDDIITDMLLIKDKMNRYVYDDEAHLARKLRVSELIPVEVMETEPDLLGIMVNMADYTIGADRGGQVTMFEDFDIDFNQEKYLIETRISGALTKPKSAVVIKRTSGTTVNPQVPTFNAETNTITVPNQTGVSYFVDDEEVAAGALVIDVTTDVEARPDSGYNFPHNTDADWTYAFTE